jgi:hypothetical protein
LRIVSVRLEINTLYAVRWYVCYVFRPLLGET